MKTHTLSTHHRRPRSIGGSNAAQNLSTVDAIKHDAWHRLFSNMTPEAIVREINSLWLDPDFKLVLVKKGE